MGGIFGKIVGGVIGGLLGGAPGAILGAVFDDEVKEGVTKLGQYTITGGGSIVGLALAGTALVLAGPGIALTVYPFATAAGNLFIRQRRMTADEQAFARAVFGDTLPFDKIILTNLLGIGDRPFCMPNVAGETIVNLGPAYENPTGYIDKPGDVAGRLFVHELTHAWQIAQHTFGIAFVCEGAWQQMTNTLVKDVYKNDGGGKPWNDYNLEQQASLIAEWFKNGRVRGDKLYPYVLGLNHGKPPPDYGQAWGPWYNIGGTPKGAPGVVILPDGTRDVYARWSDDTLWQKTRTPAGWIDWKQIDAGCQLASSPVVVSNGQNHRDVYALGKDGNLWHKWWLAGHGWSGWDNLGGKCQGAPGVVYTADGRTDIYARWFDNTLWQKTWTGKAWVEWRQLDATCRLASSPVVISGNAKHRDVYALGTDGHLYHKWWTGSWSGWEDIGGQCKGAAGVVITADGIVDIYGRWPDDTLWQKSWTGKTWVEWHQLDPGCTLASSPVVTSKHARQRNLWALGTDGALYHKVWN